MKKIIYSPGEPSGIGPDLIIKLSSSKLWEDLKIPIVSIGDPKLFIDRAALLKKKIKIVEQLGYDAILMGTSLMKSKNSGKKLERIIKEL